ncbi:glycosyltransferase family 1 protein [bacterium]|nr:MAG: glycosyltransferase family 1 protein [bacterium]
MKILICTGIFPPEQGGPATYSAGLGGELIKLGHEVRVITYSTPTLSPPYQGGDEEGVIRIARSAFKPWHYFKYFRAVKKNLSWADVVYAQDPVSAGYPTYLACKVRKKRYILKIVGDYSWEQAMGRRLTDKLLDDFQKLENYPRAIARMRQIQILVAKEARAIITPSAYLKRIVAGWGVKEGRIIVVYNGISKVAEIGREEARRELSMADGEFWILSVGRKVPWKGFELLEDVVREIQIDEPNIKLKILNFADRQTTDKFYRAADLFVLNTGYEGFSHTILEVMTAGLPVITTKIGGNPEVVKDGENGILVEYNNREQLKAAILKLYHDPELRARFVRNSSQIVQNFTFKKMIDQAEGVLKRCAS